MTSGEENHLRNMERMRQMLDNLELAKLQLTNELSEDNPDNIEMRGDDEVLTTFTMDFHNDAHNADLSILRRPGGGIRTTQSLDHNGTVRNIDIEIFHTPYTNGDGEKCSVTESIGAYFYAMPVSYHRNISYGSSAVENLIHDKNIRQTIHEDDIRRHHATFDDKENAVPFINLEGGKPEEGIEIGSVDFFREKLLEIKRQFTDAEAHAPIAVVPRRKP